MEQAFPYHKQALSSLLKLFRQEVISDQRDKRGDCVEGGPGWDARPYTKGDVQKNTAQYLSSNKSHVNLPSTQPIKPTREKANEQTHHARCIKDLFRDLFLFFSKGVSLFLLCFARNNPTTEKETKEKNADISPVPSNPIVLCKTSFRLPKPMLM